MIEVTPVTGEALYDEMRIAAHAAHTTILKFASALYPADTGWKLEQLRIARCPRPLTIARVRALIAGEPIPAAGVGNNKGRTGRRGALVGDAPETRLTGDEISRRRDLTEQALAERLPGETIHDAIRRLTHGATVIADLRKGPR